MGKKIAVIIISYNSQQDLPDCLNSLKKQTLLPDQVVIVDNASKDDSVEYIEQYIQNIQKDYQQEDQLKIDLIKNKENCFFAPANNQGIKRAIENNSSLDYIFLLNPDTFCEPDCLEKLVESAEKQENQKVFAFQPLILCHPKTDKIQSAGDKIHFLGFGYCGDYLKPAIKENIDQLSKDITYASGAGVLVPCRHLDKVGLLDSDLLLYHEDLDWAIRARLLGLGIKLAAKARMYHKYTDGISNIRWYWSERNRLLTLIKFYKLPTLILIFPAWLIMEAGVWGYSLLTGWITVKIKSIFSAWKQFPKTFKKRKLIQKQRVISDRELSKYLESHFNFAGLTHPLLKYIVNPFLGFYWNIIKKIIFW